MTNFEKLIETLQNAPIERTACFIHNNIYNPCSFCVAVETNCTQTPRALPKELCQDGIKLWLESEVE